jgi:ribulose-bisphosphate carboxylase small chain
MWKLPMYGCTSPDEVLAEVRACTRAFPDCFIRVAGFDNIKQVQCSSFLAHRPANDRTFQPVTGRQVGDGRAAPAAGGSQQNYSW